MLPQDTVFTEASLLLLLPACTSNTEAAEGLTGSSSVDSTGTLGTDTSTSHRAASLLHLVLSPTYRM